MDDAHTPDGPLPSIPPDIADNPDLDLTSHITGIHPPHTLSDTLERAQRLASFMVTPVLDPALELGRAVASFVAAEVAKATASAEARSRQQIDALAQQVDLLTRRLDRLRDVL